MKKPWGGPGLGGLGGLPILVELGPWVLARRVRVQSLLLPATLIRCSKESLTVTLGGSVDGIAFGARHVGHRASKYVMIVAAVVRARMASATT